MSNIRKLDITKVHSPIHFIQMYKDYTSDLYKHMVLPMTIEMSNTFNRKKNAWQLQHTKSRPIGSIDMSRIYAYKTSDNIFRKKRMQPKGKNHAIVVMCDFSGSMEDSIVSVMVNAFALCLFGKRNNIPVEIYSFTDKNMRDDSDLILRVDVFSTDIVNIMNTTMSIEMLKQIFFEVIFGTVGVKQLKNTYRIKYSDVEKLMGTIPTIYMGSTPLVPAMMCGVERAAMFKERYDRVSLITLTDGMGNVPFLYNDSNIFNCPFNSKFYVIDEEMTYHDNVPFYKRPSRITTHEIILANEILKDLNINSIQINLTQMGIEGTYPINNLINEDKIPFWKAAFLNDGMVKVEGLLKYNSIIFVNQKILNSLSSTKQINTLKTEPEEKIFTKSEARRMLAKKDTELKVMKIISSTVISEVCSSYLEG